MNEQQLYMYCLQNEFNPRTSKFRTNPPFQDPGICKDKNVNSCKAWADAGECEKNPIYMKGSGTQVGHPLHSANIQGPRRYLCLNSRLGEVTDTFVSNFRES
eukprot:scaffold42733_cov25-Tisochrysis_lutea.AAC.1